jgi:hypothetical protein
MEFVCLFVCRLVRYIWADMHHVCSSDEKQLGTGPETYNTDEKSICGTAINKEEKGKAVLVLN